MKVTLEQKIQGCLIGSAIGAELGFARVVQPERFDVEHPMDMFDVELTPTVGYKDEPNRTTFAKTTAFIDLGVRAYLAKNGRVTPEEFAHLFKDDPGIASPVFALDPVHTSQEVLREGMHPRISGMGNAPSGYICASMPAVGIYHCGDSEYAYFDGVELASVTQPRVGADWAGLCAAAIASAFHSDARPETIVDTVLKIAHQNNRDLFYQLNVPLKPLGWASKEEELFINWWYYSGSRLDLENDKNYWMYNPISLILPILKRYGDNVKKSMTLLIAPPQETCMVSAVIAGAILGALHGADAFPAEWRKWAEPVADQWGRIADTVSSKFGKERKIISFVDNLISENAPGGESMLFDKVYGCILAGAIGNAMGSPVEGSHYREIDRKYPGGLDRVLDPKSLENEDDNQMAMMLIETYLGRAGLPVMARHFGATWKDRMNRDKYFINCMGHCYDLIRQGWDPRITGHWTQVTGSTVMCMEPVGIYHIADPDNALIDATAISYMYQRGADVTVAAVLAATVAEAFSPNATVDSVCQTALQFAPKQKMVTFDDRSPDNLYDYLEMCLTIADNYDDVLAARPELYEKCLSYYFIDPVELFALSLAMFKVANGDIRQSAIGGTNIGRDSDTIAGRAAMFAGILQGGHAVPRDWLEMFKPEVLQRIQCNCQRFVSLIECKADRLRRRQALHERWRVRAGTHVYEPSCAE